jgi:hypothetical protein
MKVEKEQGNSHNHKRIESLHGIQKRLDNMCALANFNLTAS